MKWKKFLAALAKLGLPAEVTDVAGVKAFLAAQPKKVQTRLNAQFPNPYPKVKKELAEGDEEEDDEKEELAEGDEEEEDSEALAEGDDDDEDEEVKPKLATKKKAKASLSAKNVVQLETQRVASLHALGATYKLDDGFVQQHIAKNSTVDAFATAARAELAKKYAAPGIITVGDDKNISSLAAGISDGIRMRAGVKVEKPHERALEFRGRSLMETCFAYCSALGIDTRSMGRTEVARTVFNPHKMAQLAKIQLAFTPSDFPNILANSIGKTLRENYTETVSTWALWMRRATVPDFKEVSRTQLSNAPRPRRLRPKQEYPDKSLSEGVEKYSISKFGEIISIAWETIVNDDLDAFSRTPQLMGSAMKRLEDDVAYFAVLKNAAMNDTVALFHANHGNLASGSANVGVPSTALLDKARKAMRMQTGLKGETLNLIAQHILVGPSLETTTEQLLNSAFDMSKQNSITYNPFRQGGSSPLKQIVEPRLESGVSIETEDGSLDTVAGSATAWYLAAAYNQIDTFEVAFLADEPNPVFEEEDAFRTDGRSYKVRHCVGAKAIDHRGLWKNPGA